MIDKKLLNLLGKNKKYIAYIILLDLLLLVTSIASTALLTFAISKFSYGESAIIINLILIMFSVVLVKVILTNLNGRIIQKMSSRILTSTRDTLYDSLLKIKTLNNSEACQLGVEGLGQLNLYFTVYIPQFIYAMIAPLLLFALFLTINRPTAIMFLICVPLIPISIILVSKYAKKIFNKYWDKYLSMGGTFLDAINGIKELKLFNYENQKGVELDESNETFRKITMKVLIMQLFSVSIMDLVAYGGAAAGIAVALFQLQSGVISSPYLVLFIILVGSEFFLPMRSLGSAFHLAMNGATAGNKLLEIIEQNKNYSDGNLKINEIRSIEFINASFKYDDGTEFVIKDFNFKFRINHLYGVAGKSGSGKSTLAKLLTKQLKLTSGELKINEHSINELENKSIFKRLAYVSYESHIFNDSIFNNFKIANPNVTKDEIYSALKKVSLEYLIDEHGFDYVIKEGSINLSGGEKQRLALAINLTSDKDLYIFDEATSNIDRESEELIIKNIYELRKKAMVIVISHSFNNLINADKILFIDKTNIYCDKHQNLLSISDKYKDIFETQLSGGMIYEA